MTKSITAKAIQAITFLFSAFGGFLAAIAPPEEADTKLAVGLASMLALCVLLLISAISKNQSPKKYKMRWLIAAGSFLFISIVAGLGYAFLTDKLTFGYPPEAPTERYVAGTMLTAQAQEYWTQQPSKTLSELVADFQGPQFRERVWKRGSIRIAKILLTINYIVLVLSLSTTIFCLTEGILTVPGETKRIGH